MNINGLKELWKIVFADTNEAIDAFFSIAFSPDRCQFIAENGQILSALYWLDCEWEGKKLAYIYAVATHPAHRGKGLASQLMRKTHTQLKALGYAGTVLKPAQGLFPFYERLGYVTSGYVSQFSANSGATPIPLKELTAQEYGPLRRSYLPENAIIQEGVTLEYLHTYAQFYEAEGALVCVTRDHSQILEYLGDPHAAPGILAAFGIQNAHLRTTGKDIPFVMYFPLNCTKAPGYLGITLE